MVTCTECGDEIGPLQKYLAGVPLADVFSTPDGETPVTLYAFRWACEHEPAESLPVRLASKNCVEKFCAKHPECVETIIDLMSQYEKDCRHQVAGPERNNWKN